MVRGMTTAATIAVCTLAVCLALCAVTIALIGIGRALDRIANK